MCFPKAKSAGTSRETKMPGAYTTGMPQKPEGLTRVVYTLGRAHLVLVNRRHYRLDIVHGGIVLHDITLLVKPDSPAQTRAPTYV